MSGTQKIKSQPVQEGRKRKRESDGETTNNKISNYFTPSPKKRKLDSENLPTVTNSTAPLSSFTLAAAVAALPSTVSQPAKREVPQHLRGLAKIRKLVEAQKTGVDSEISQLPPSSEPPLTQETPPKPIHKNRTSTLAARSSTSMLNFESPGETTFERQSTDESLRPVGYSSRKNGMNRFNNSPTRKKPPPEVHIASATPTYTSSSYKYPAPPSVPLSEEQQLVLNLVLKGHSVFFTGSAGTGKSFLLRHIVEHLRYIHGRESVFVTASTGVAACNIGGVTLHSFSGVGLGQADAETLASRVANNRNSCARWRQAAVLIIDEISMIDADFFDKIEHVARIVRDRPQHPFGGVQLVLCGDFLQLPPVDDSGRNGGTAKKFCFEAACWSKVVQYSVELRRVFRQKDPQFVELLNEARIGRLSDGAVRLLRDHCLASTAAEQVSDGIEPTRLYPHRRDVDRENQMRLDALPGESRFYDAIDRATNDFFLNMLKTGCAAPTRLELKVNAQVILLKNLDFDLGLVNGARGVVIGFGRFKPEEDASNDEEREGTDDNTLYPIVKFAGSGVVKKLRWETWSIETGGLEVASRQQIPLALAWALSIHKSQGMTIERVVMDLAGVFEYGQAYVALSRATCLEGLRLKSFEPSRLRAHPRVLQFYSTLKTFSGSSSASASNGEASQSTEWSATSHQLERRSSTKVMTREEWEQHKLQRKPSHGATAKSECVIDLT